MAVGVGGQWWRGRAGVALRAESRITPPKIQGGAAEVKTPASFPTLSHNFGKPRSARRIRAARAGLERPRQAAASDEHRHVVRKRDLLAEAADIAVDELESGLHVAPRENPVAKNRSTTSGISPLTRYSRRGPKSS